MPFLDWASKNGNTAFGLFFGVALLLVIAFAGLVGVIRAIRGSE